MNKKEIFKKVIVESQHKKFNIIPRGLYIPLDAGKTITLYGPRRCGKTFLFYQIIREFINRGIPFQNIAYINFEDERIQPFSKDDWDVFLDAYLELYPDNTDRKTYFFLDEIQETPLWDKFVRRLSEQPDFQLFLTGSSSKLFSGEISTALRGRTLSYFLMPFSFKEFLMANKFKIEDNLEYSPSRHKAKKLFQEYMKFGGFPEIFDKEDSLKIQILQGYFDLIFYKDIVDRYKIRNFTLMKNIMRYLLTHFASTFSFTSYYNFLKSSGSKIGKDTIFEYISCLEEVNFIKLVPLFDYSLKKQTVNPKKIYCIDTGLVTAVSFQFSEDKGRYLENMVFLELLRKEKEIYYFKIDNNEVDFLITKKGRPEQLIQVSDNIEDKGTKEREIRALVTASKKLNIKNCLILTDGQKSDIHEDGLKINVLPVWKWLLS
ncbi:MAG: ATP-binding protein [Candidatus Omnitrophota bacterium]